MIYLIRRFTDTLAELAVIYAAMIILAALAFGHFEHRDIWTSIYWAMTTALSVGYGDISPATVGGRITALLLMHVVLLGIIPMIVVRLTARVIENRDAFTHEEQEEALEILRHLDRDNRGAA